MTRIKSWEDSLTQSVITCVLRARLYDEDLGFDLEIWTETEEHALTTIVATLCLEKITNCKKSKVLCFVWINFFVAAP